MLKGREVRLYPVKLKLEIKMTTLRVVALPFKIQKVDVAKMVSLTRVV